MSKFHFIEFYHESTGYVEHSMPPRFDGPKALIPACGSDSVYILDGRLSSGNKHSIARQVCHARQFPAYKLHVGNFKQSTSGGLYEVDLSLD